MHKQYIYCYWIPYCRWFIYILPNHFHHLFYSGLPNCYLIRNPKYSALQLMIHHVCRMKHLQIACSNGPPTSKPINPITQKQWWRTLSPTTTCKLLSKSDSILTWNYFTVLTFLLCQTSEIPHFLHFAKRIPRVKKATSFIPLHTSDHCLKLLY